MPQVVFNPFTASFDFVGGSGSSGTPASPDTSIQFNDGGIFGGAKINYTEPTATSIKLKVEDQPTTDTQGYDLTIQGGKGNGNAEPGEVNITGAGSANTNGDYVYGAVNIIGGSDTTQGQGFSGGPVNITGGESDSGGSTFGGAVNITGGAANTGGGQGGPVNITSGNGYNGQSGVINITTPSPTNGAAGDIFLVGGDGSGGRGGDINFDGGDGSGAFRGGEVAFGAGNNNGLGDAGDVVFLTGHAAGPGRNGQFQFFPNGGNTVGAILDFDSLTTTDKTFTFPNQSGTIALTSTDVLFDSIAAGASASSTTGDITAARSSTTGAVFFGSDGQGYFYRDSANSIQFGPSLTSFQVGSNSADARFILNSNATYQVKVANSSGVGFFFGATSGTADGVFSNNSGTERMRITDGGNVGLGVTPDELLHLKDGGNIKVGTSTGTKIGTATTQKLGFFNATPIVQPTVTGSRGGNAALASLLTQLASLGLIVDSSS